MQAWIEKWIDEMRECNSLPARDEILLRPLRIFEQAKMQDREAAREDLQEQMRALADLALRR